MQTQHNQSYSTSSKKKERAWAKGKKLLKGTFPAAINKMENIQLLCKTEIPNIGQENLLLRRSKRPCSYSISNYGVLCMRGSNNSMEKGEVNTIRCPNADIQSEKIQKPCL